MLLHLKDGVIILQSNDIEILCENCDIIKTIIELDTLCDEIWLPMISCEIMDLVMVYLVWTEFLDIENIQDKLIEMHYLNVFGILEYYLPILIDKLKCWPIKEIVARQGFLSKFNDQLYYLVVSYLPANLANNIDWPNKYIKIYLYDDPEKLYEYGYPSLASKIIEENPDLLNSQIIIKLLPNIIKHNNIRIFYMISDENLHKYINESMLLLIAEQNRVKMLEYLFMINYKFNRKLIEKMYVYAIEFKSHNTTKYIYNKTKLYLKENYNSSNNLIHY
jgi:hypothetical protein